jgi:hypothetical protein
MAFLGGNTDSLRISLTEYGYKVLSEKGLVNEIIYYSFYDPNVNYDININNTLMSDINGIKKNIVPDNIIITNNLIL